MSQVDGFTRTHTYREDSSRHALERALLDKGPAPPRLDDDALTAMAMVAVAIIKVVGACKILERWVSSINVCIMLIPFFMVKSYQRKVKLPRQVG
jgi:hypothetical protein